MTLRRKLSEFMVKTTPELYRIYVAIEKSEMVLYVQLLKALYRCLRSALIFYKKMMDDLESRGYSLNPYDTCVMNKMIGEWFHP